jgi:uracil-DNA glycosylase
LPRAGNGLSLLSLLIIDRAVKKRLCIVMGSGQQIFERDAAASMLGWWRDAGVDAVISETPHDWLGISGPVKSCMQSTPEPAVSALPQSLDALVNHLMTGELPDAGPPNRRVRPAGDAASDLMILTDFPDPSDLESGELFDDAVFTKMLEAIGHGRATVYIASLCPGRPMTGRLAPESIHVLVALAKQHIMLAAPKQLWLVGSAASRAILGIDDAEAKGKLHSVNHLDTIMEAIATAHPRMFDGSKSRKAAAWAEMQRLMTREHA